MKSIAKLSICGQHTSFIQTLSVCKYLSFEIHIGSWQGQAVGSVNPLK
ncbi:hypothetical protein LSPH26S_00564 [Lysinibacillus sphaericus]